MFLESTRSTDTGSPNADLILSRYYFYNAKILGFCSAVCSGIDVEDIGRIGRGGDTRYDMGTHYNGPDVIQK